MRTCPPSPSIYKESPVLIGQDICSLGLAVKVLVVRFTPWSQETLFEWLFQPLLASISSMPFFFFFFQCSLAVHRRTNSDYYNTVSFLRKTNFKFWHLILAFFWSTFWKGAFGMWLAKWFLIPSFKFSEANFNSTFWFLFLLLFFSVLSFYSSPFMLQLSIKV